MSSEIALSVIMQTLVALEMQTAITLIRCAQYRGLPTPIKGRPQSEVTVGPDL